MRIDFHPAATEELELSADWYAARSETAAIRFVEKIDAALQKIASDPKRFPRCDARHQACAVERFPFQIVFRNDGDRIIIIAVAHAKRRPNYWQRRK